MPAVEQLDVGVYVIPLEEPESDGTFTWTDTSMVIVEPTAGGQRGLGFTYGPAACLSVIEDVLAPAVLGAEVFDVAAIWREMVAAIRNAGRPGIASAAIAAVDIALWDLKAKLLGLPLCQVLGLSHSSVAIYGSGGFTSLTEAELEAQLGGWVHGQGIPRVKMKIGTAWGRAERRDVERVARARATIGDRADLYVDANGGYTRKQAVRLAGAFADAGVTWFEEPVSSDDLAGLHEIRGLVAADVAAGEYGYDLVYFERMCAAGAVDVLQADVSRCAGISEWIRVAAVAAAHGLEVSGHCAPLLHLHAACAVPNIRHLEYFADHVRAHHLLFDGVPEPVDGRLAPDLGRPGLGLTLKAADAEPYARRRSSLTAGR
jgi:L-alanine-DL-glutamate epimerase-like enolase superfamily enzyme